MATRECWKCGGLAVMLPQKAGHYVFEPPGAERMFGEVQATFYRCPGCESPNVGLAERRGYASSDIDKTANGEQAVWLPQPVQGHDYVNVPPAIAAAADEAHRCRSIDAVRGTVILARAVIEATCKDKGATGRTLFDRIDALHAMGLINELVRQEAHEIRLVGNDMAHGDFGSGVSSSDADDVLDLMAEVLEEVYQRPARVAERQVRRSAATPSRSERAQALDEMVRISEEAGMYEATDGPPPPTR